MVNMCVLLTACDETTSTCNISIAFRLLSKCPTFHELFVIKKQNLAQNFSETLSVDCGLFKLEQALTSEVSRFCRIQNKTYLKSRIKSRIKKQD